MQTQGKATYFLRAWPHQNVYYVQGGPCHTVVELASVCDGGGRGQAMKRQVGAVLGAGSSLQPPTTQISSREFAPTRHERGGFIRDPTSRAGGVYFEIPRSAHRISFTADFSVGDTSRAGGVYPRLNPPCSCGVPNR